jgi:hypothetical protein
MSENANMKFYKITIFVAAVTSKKLYIKTCKTNFCSSDTSKNKH